jgi:hypothetical protein
MSVLYRRWRGRPCGRWSSVVALSGGGCKPPQGASVKSRGAERCGKDAPRVRQVWVKKANASEPLLKCRKVLQMTSKPGYSTISGMSLGDTRCTAQVVSGMKVARAWLWLRYGTWEPVALRMRIASGEVLACGCAWKGEPQAAGTVRGRVPMWGTGADCPVVAVMPGNAGEAKGTDRPGLFLGQPLCVGGAW